jgi:hypothetical protein
MLPPLTVGLSVVQRRRRNERNDMMNDTHGWMNGWSGGGMWVWTVIGIVLVALLVVAVSKLSKK